ncbi:oxidoreductase [Natronomonas sp. CBA1123]|uniref:FAD-dependent oxidoreductase n=1 Tax=Natronomonas sp. CBA1123 TaxID=2668070 RepID=UPI0012EA5298|nr:FAD-dependent oxidoreductase [Natronomonas sp. CBA1123]MUV86583.1 oxidoreductase [Natronomonas sp. CBA1123]
MDPIETTVAAVRDVGPDAVAIDLDTPPAFDAEPGQFVKLTATVGGKDESRFYTVSSPDTDDTFEFTISYDPEEGGAFSEYLLNLEAGDTVTITGPFGDDYYEGEHRAIVLAGGPGIGPAVAIAERALAEGNEAAIVYRDDTPLHEERLSNIANAGASVFVLSEDESLTDAVADVLTNADGEQVFVYGFADFLKDATAAIEAAGGDADAAKAENFG